MILLTAREAAEMVQRKPATIRSWAHRRRLTAVQHDPRTGAALYRRRDIWLAEKAARENIGGRPTVPRRRTRDQLHAQFWAQVQGGDYRTCWIWTGHKNNRGYGLWRVAGKTIGAHRWAYIELVAELPRDLHLDHLCRTPLCVNVWHLEPVTQAVNNRRAAQARRVTASKIAKEPATPSTCRLSDKRPGTQGA